MSSAMGRCSVPECNQKMQGLDKHSECGIHRSCSRSCLCVLCETGTDRQWALVYPASKMIRESSSAGVTPEKRHKGKFAKLALLFLSVSGKVGDNRQRASSVVGFSSHRIFTWDSDKWGPGVVPITSFGSSNCVRSCLAGQQDTHGYTANSWTGLAFPWLSFGLEGSGIN